MARRSILAAILFSSLTLPVSASGLASWAEGGRTQLVRHRVTIPEDGSLDEILALSAEWKEKVLDRADDFGEVRYFLLEVEPDARYELVVLYELRDSADLPPDARRVPDLMREAWGGDEGAQTFLARMWRYIDPQQNERQVLREILTGGSAVARSAADGPS